MKKQALATTNRNAKTEPLLYVVLFCIFHIVTLFFLHTLIWHVHITDLANSLDYSRTSAKRNFRWTSHTSWPPPKYQQNLFSSQCVRRPPVISTAYRQYPVQPHTRLFNLYIYPTCNHFHPRGATGFSLSTKPCKPPIFNAIISTTLKTNQPSQRSRALFVALPPKLALSSCLTDRNGLRDRVENWDVFGFKRSLPGGGSVL